MKQFGLKKCIIAKPSFVVGYFYSCPTNTHVKNEKLVVSTRHDTILAQLHNGVKQKTKRNIFSLLQFGRLYNKEDP